MKSPQKIGIDCRMIKESGIGRYIENFISNLSSIDSKNRYFLFVLDKKNFSLKLGSNFELVDAPFMWHGLEEQTNFLKLINSFDLDLYHSPHPNMPYFYDKKFVITIHDLTMLKEKTGRASTYLYPIYFMKWLVFKIMLSMAVKKAFKIITVSNFVKEQIVQEFRIPQEKVQVIYNGVSDSIHKIDDLNAINGLREKFKINKPYLFYIGNAYPHKNIESLIMAFELLNQKSELQLFLGGKEDYFYKRIKAKYGNLSNVIFGGYLSDHEISILYSNCEAFVYPSISEGFGIQIVEALKVGCRVVCSNKSSFPEIAGMYAFYFNPYNIEDISNTIEKAIKSKDKYSESELKEYLKKFDWKNSAQLHYEIYQEN